MLKMENAFFLFFLFGSKSKSVKDQHKKNFPVNIGTISAKDPRIYTTESKQQNPSYQQTKVKPVTISAKAGFKETSEFTP